MGVELTTFRAVSSALLAESGCEAEARVAFLRFIGELEQSPDWRPDHETAELIARVRAQGEAGPG